MGSLASGSTVADVGGTAALLARQPDPSEKGLSMRTAWHKALWLLLLALGQCGEQPLAGNRTELDAPAALGQAIETRGFRPLLHAVVGGHLAGRGEYSATGVLLYTITSISPSSPLIGAMLCTGTLIAPDVVILAAHCREPQLPTHYNMVVNYYFSLTDDVSSFGPQIAALPRDAVRVANFAAHPAYEQQGQPRQVGHADDVALVYLERALLAAPAALAPPALAKQLLVAEAPITIVGYGRSQDLFYGAGDDGKKMVGASTLAEVGAYELEIGRTKVDAYKCFGDSGGPTFVADHDGRQWLVGITSRGAALSVTAQGMRHGMACRRGAIDTRLDAYRGWVSSQMEAACDGGERPACELPFRSLPPEESAATLPADAWP